MTAPLRVIVVDDHPLYREGLVAALEAMDSVTVVAEASSGEEALDAIAAHHPDLVLMDLQMPGVNGIEATRLAVARQPGVAVLVVTMVEDDDTVAAAISAGARGYIVKGSNRAQIRRAVEAVGEGHLVVGPTMAGRMAARLDGDHRPAPPFPELTERERAVLALVAQGLTNSAIAARLHLSAKTVRNYVSMVFAKIHAADRAAAIAKARDAGLGNRDL